MKVKWLHFPFMEAAGMWTTPSDMANFVTEILRAYAGKSDQFVSPEMVLQTLTPQIEIQEGSLTVISDVCGLGFDLAYDGGQLRISMTGGTWGSTCVVWAFPETGKGAVVMTNSARGTLLLLEVLASLGVEYGWTDSTTG